MKISNLFVLIFITANASGSVIAQKLSDPIVDSDVVFQEENGIVAVEAEYFYKQSKSDIRQWYRTSKEEIPEVGRDEDGSHCQHAGNNAYLEILPDTRVTHDDKLIAGENFSNKAGQMGILHYRVKINNPGRYYVWVRAFSSGAEDNGLHVGINGQWPETGQRMQWCKGKRGWRWESKQRTEKVHCGEPYLIYLDIEEAGVHEITFSMREDGFEFDRFLLTNEREYIPRGIGPEVKLASGILPEPFPLVLQGEKTRLMILADMGNEPDEVQQMMHMLMYSNEFDLEGLVAVTGKYLQPASKDPYKQKLHPELFHHLIEGYTKVVENLKKHADGYPEPEFLTSLVASGQTGYGIENTGAGLSSEGSDLIIKMVEKEDPRPVYIVVNAGSNTLAQAIKDYQANHSEEELKKFISKLRVYENGAQDNAGAWICANYPEIKWIRSNYQTYCYGGPARDGGADNQGHDMELGPHTWQPYEYSPLGQHQWALEHIIADHGPFGAYWPLRLFIHNEESRLAFVEGGGTIPWLGLANKGLYSIEHPHWGGWSGRFTREKMKNFWSKHSSVNKDEKTYGDFYLYYEDSDEWVNPEDGEVYNDLFTPVWRWRRAFFNDFKCRMDWCNQPFENANHNPVAAINDDPSNAFIFYAARPGEEIDLDASASSDPDQDELEFLWYNYFEAGTYPERITLEEASGKILNLKVPKDASGKQIHIILQVKDKNQIGSLYDYRRIVIDVE